MYKKIILPLLMFLPMFAFGQASVTGKVVDAQNGKPLSAVKVTVIEQNISTQTNAQGQFTFSYLDAGNAEISFALEGYFMQIKATNLLNNQEINLETIALRPDVAAETKQDVVMQMSEQQLENEAGNVAITGSFSTQTDVYLSQTGYNFSPMRFQTRGYESKYESTYINGVRFMDAERGGFNYSSIGGLNNATRTKDVVYGLTPNTFSFGNLGQNTNINTRASSFAAGTNVNIAAANRNYTSRVQFLYGTGLMQNGWAFAISGVVRYADDAGYWTRSRVDGMFYNSGGLFLSAEKVLTNHRISFVAFGAPTRRGGQSAITKEARDLTGSIYYNPYWGYQNGQIRNSRIVKTFDPTAILSWDWKISETQRLRTGIGYHYSFYSNSAFLYNGTHPDPSYYRNMPSFVASYDEKTANDMANEWRNNESIRQTQWDGPFGFYAQNINNQANLDAGIKGTPPFAYILLRRHNDLMEGTLNSTYINQLSKNVKLTVGIEGRLSKGIHYQTVDDMLGASPFLDIDTYANRDIEGSNSGNWSVQPDVRYTYNDVNNPNRKVGQGDKFAYDYDLNVRNASAFAQIDGNWNKLYVYLGIKGTYQDFWRFGRMENGRAWWLRYLYDHPNEDNPIDSLRLGQKVKSLGKSDVWYFMEPSAKAGFMYNIDNKSRISFNVLAEKRAPLVQDSYISPNIKDKLVPNLKPEQILAMDLNYSFNYKPIRGRIGAFRTVINDAVDNLGYYDDELGTFVNHLLSGYNKIYQGVELGVKVPVNSILTLSAAGTYADYHYTSNATGYKSAENGSLLENPETVYTKGLKIAAGPQFAANITASFFYKMWFIDVTLNYFDNNYFNFAPNRFTQSNFGNLPAAFYSKENIDMLKNHFIDSNGKLHLAQLNEWLNDKTYKAYWGLSEKETMKFGFYDNGIIILDENGKPVGIGVSEARQKLATQEKLKPGFMLDLSIGKLIYLKNRNSINFNLSLSNILNNTDMITGGYQQARIPTVSSTKKLNPQGLDWFPNKYYYAYGFNFFLNIGYKF